jgi:hypothetical protein
MSNLSSNQKQPSKRGKAKKKRNGSSTMASSSASGFQSLGLSESVYRGVQRLGFQVRRFLCFSLDRFFFSQ